MMPDNNRDQATSVLVMVAPNGAYKNKQDHPALPMSIAELIETAQFCKTAGAAAMHAHLRDANGAHWLDADEYRRLSVQMKDILPLQITSEAAGIYKPEEQMRIIDEVRPAAVSLALRELAPDMHDLPVFEAFLNRLKKYRTSPQFILYSAVELRQFLAWHDAGHIPYDNPFLLFVLGRYAQDQQSDPADLDAFLAVLDGREMIWAVCAFGARESACLAYAAARGGHIRVGFENNLYLPDGRPADDNAALVAVMVEMLDQQGKKPMTPAQARALFARAAQ